MVENRLFVISGETDKCEVCDSTCKKFIALKEAVLTEKCFFQNPTVVLNIENTIFVFGENTSSLL